MTHFEFHGELFTVRSAVFEALADRGFVWLSNFGAIDLHHDLYGLEVTSIRTESDARDIKDVLRRMLPDWHHARTFYEDRNVGELGWKVVISRNPENFRDLYPETDAGSNTTLQLLCRLVGLLVSRARQAMSRIRRK